MNKRREMRHYMEQAGAAVFGIEGVRRYIEECGQGDSPLTTAIRKLMAAVDPKS